MALVGKLSSGVNDSKRSEALGAEFGVPERGFHRFVISHMKEVESA